MVRMRWSRRRSEVSVPLWDSLISSTPRPPNGIERKDGGSVDVQPVSSVARARTPPRSDRAPRHILTTSYDPRSTPGRSRKRSTLNALHSDPRGVVS
jgi:hypothetical protein